MFQFEVNDESLLSGLDKIVAGLSDRSGLMAALAGELEAQTEANFAAEGRPDWLGLAPATIAKRERDGTWPGKMLQVSAAGLASSIVTDYGNDYSQVGSNKPYAAVQHAGGQAGRGHKVTIPARPYFPVDALGNLQPEASVALLTEANAYLAGLGFR